MNHLFRNERRYAAGDANRAKSHESRFEGFEKIKCWMITQENDINPRDIQLENPEMRERMPN